MLVRVEKSDLLSAAAIAVRAVSTRPSLQVLTGIHLTANGDTITLTATDMELALSASTSANVTEPGDTVVPGRLFTDIVRSIPTSPLELHLDNSTLHITAGSSRFTLRTLPSTDFPAFNRASADSATELPVEIFTDDIPRVARAASRDETRPHLTGILLTQKDTKLHLVATDSYRLALCEVPTTPSTINANIPSRSLQEVGRIAASVSPPTVRLAIEQARASFTIGAVNVESRLVEGRFPSYEQLLPSTWEHELRVDRSELLDVVKRVALITQQHTPVRLSLSSGELTVSAESPEVGSATESLPVPYEGSGITIGFNPEFLRDGLETALSDTVHIRFLNPLRPALIESSDDSGKRFLYLVMPIRLDNT